MKRTVERGEVYWVEFKEEGKRVLELVVQNDIGNLMSQTTIVVPLIKESNGSKTPLMLKLQNESNQKLNGYSVAYQPRTISKERMKEKVGKVSAKTMREIDRLAKDLFKVKSLENEVYWVRMPGKVGSEQKGTRPCIYLKDERIIIPLTSSKNMRNKLPTQFEVSIEDFTNGEEAVKNGMGQKSRAMAEQIQFLFDEKRIVGKIGKLKSVKNKELNQSIITSIAVKKV